MQYCALFVFAAPLSLQHSSIIRPSPDSPFCAFTCISHIWFLWYFYFYCVDFPCSPLFCLGALPSPSKHLLQLSCYVYMCIYISISIHIDCTYARTHVMFVSISLAYFSYNDNLQFYPFSCNDIISFFFIVEYICHIFFICCYSYKLVPCFS